ncbi:hypothetical protein Poli38472_005305 [Pythium oligandrum]|uniref:Cyclic nucleotide-binding domain-containing protein n=1 Tax=Pythium oligandrum TaxID=41045 RepID=A0A8K1FKC5_PYTOL|nr:hypothetical protein Poli38472_005305 [Pythium oligandrum]|eukprot:TMW62687.1 hypothetical protein Poli38472_005305 [Pythium oligandrum]
MNPRDDIIDIYHDSIEGGSRFMIHPNSKFRRIWDVLTALGVLYVCVKVPLAIGYNYIDWSSFSVLDTLVDVYFIVDMVVTMRTGIFSNGAVVMDSKVVLRRYLRSWFIIDVISNFPLALFVDNSARKSIKMVKLQKLPKLLRLGRLLKYLREYAKYYNLALSFVAMSMGLHFFACLWASLFNNCYNANGAPICGRSMMGRMYIQSVHIVLLMFLGISENTTYSSISALVDPHEDATIEIYIISVVIFLLGLIFSSFFFGNVLALIISWDQQNAQFRNRMDIIAAEMRYYELPDELQHRVRRNYDYLWINQRAYSDMMLLNQPGISKTLRTTIALHLYKDLVKTVPFFAGSDARFLGKVCLALETAVYLPGDTIIYYDDIGKEMFIVRKGLVEIIIPEADNTEKRVYLRDGNFFGETALVIDVRRTNTVKAVNICDLNVLSKSAFNEIVAEYPEFGERMKRTVIKRQLDNMNIQSPTEKMKIQNQLNMVVEKSLKERRMSVSLRTIYRAKKLGDKLKEIADRAAKSNQIKRTTDRLNRRLQQHSDVSSDEDDLEFEDYQSQLDVATEDPLLATASRITPLVEESEEELARRESRSVFTPPTPTGSDAARNSPHQ